LVVVSQHVLCKPGYHHIDGTIDMDHVQRSPILQTSRSSSCFSWDW
jgi:hypothetical protein